MAKNKQERINAYRSVLNAYQPCKFFFTLLHNAVYKTKYEGSVMSKQTVDTYELDWRDQFSTAFGPWVDMKEDAKQIADRYDEDSRLRDDLLQPIYGVGNIIFSLFSLTVALPIHLTRSLMGSALFLLFQPIFLVYGLFNEGYLSDGYKKLWQDEVAKYGIALTSVLHAINHAIRGSTQVLFTPLTYLIKIPIRSIATNATKGITEQYYNDLITAGGISQYSPCSNNAGVIGTNNYRQSPTGISYSNSAQAESEQTDNSKTGSTPRQGYS